MIRCKCNAAGITGITEFNHVTRFGLHGVLIPVFSRESDKEEASWAVEEVMHGIES